MIEERQLDSMSLDQLRKVAARRNVPGASKLRKQEAVRLLRRLRELEAMPHANLLASLSEYRIKGIKDSSKKHLALIRLQTDRYEQIRVPELRILAREHNIEGVGRQRKKEIVKRLLHSYAEGLKSERFRDDRRLPIPQQIRSLAGLPLTRWLGRAIQVSSAAGITISLMSMVLVPILASRASIWIEGMTGGISREVTIAAGSMRQLSFALNEGVQTLEAAEVSIRRIGDSLQNTEPLIGSTAELLGEQAPTIIEDIRNALISAEEGARAVDQVLRNLARLGSLTGVAYAPNRPLDEGISDVAESLEPMPPALRGVGGELDRASSSLGEVRISLDNVGNELIDFADEVQDKDSILANLAEDLDILSEVAENAGASVKLVRLIALIIIEFLLIGFALGQSAIFYVGRNITQNIS